MADIAQVLVVHGHREFAESARYAFARAGAGVRLAQPGCQDREVTDEVELLVIAAREDETALRLLAEAAALPRVRTGTLPVLLFGGALSRERAIVAGASEAICAPIHSRDLVTIARLLVAPQSGDALRGELAEHQNLFFLTRALVALGGRWVLTLGRGLRRGEIRFWDGEVTSAEVGALHGQAAFQQLLFWRVARYELRPEDVVRRQQIPMATDEFFQESERFLRATREALGNLDPDAIYIRNGAAAGTAMAGAPGPVREILGLFESGRALADVIEDSPFRTFETCRLAHRMAELRVIVRAPNQNTLMAGLFTEADLEEEEEGLSGTPGPKSETASVDWVPLLPSGGEFDAEQFAQVVPAAAVAGEIASSPAVGAGGSGPVRLPSEPGFSSEEEGFFRRGGNPVPPPETFEDLDEGYDVPRSFWARLFRSPSAPLRRKHRADEDP